MSGAHCYSEMWMSLKSYKTHKTVKKIVQNTQIGLPTLDLGIPGLRSLHSPPFPSFLFPLPSLLFSHWAPPQWGLGRTPSRQTIWCISQPKGAALVATVFVHFHKNKFKVKSCVTDKHDTKYNTLISEQPYIHARWSIFTFPGQNEPRPGHRTPWVNSGTILAIPGRLASLHTEYHLNLNRHRLIKTIFMQQEFNIRQLVIVFSFPKTVTTVCRGFRRK